jgi:tetratricopeptide (TPR) repeat protein
LMRYFSSQFNAAHDDRPALRKILDAARAKIPALPRAAAADLSYQLIQTDAWLNRGPKYSTVEPLKAVVQQYAGTDAAMRAELDLARNSVSDLRDITARVAMLDKFVADHPGTCAAANALRSKGFELGANIPPGQDPTPLFLLVFETVRQLEASPYRDCPMTAEARPERLVAGLYASRPSYAPGSVDRLLAAYQEFVKTHFGPDATDPRDGLGYMITSRLLELYRAKGEGVAALDRFLAGLENEVAAREAVRYLRALIYVIGPSYSMSQVPPETLPPDEARTRLTALHATGTGLFQRKALATLAWLYLYDGDIANAREAYGRYVKLYPGSGYAWVAALRAGQCAAELGDWKGAAAAYQEAARSYSSMPVARVLGHTYAARVLEGMSQAGPALAQYQAAFDAWDKDYGTRYALVMSRRQPKPADPLPVMRDPTEVTLEALTGRIAQLKETTAGTGADVVEQGRWLIEHRRCKEAAQLLADFAKRYPRSANIPQAQYLAHKARLYDALETLDIEGAADEAAGVKILDMLAVEAYDFPVLVAKMSRAILVAQQGSRDEAEKAMRAALDEWRARQTLREPTTALEKDVAEIRAAVFLPSGGAVYGSAGWNAFSWPKTAPPFSVVNPDVSVKFADAAVARVSLAQRFPGLDNVLFIDTEQVGVLSDVMTRLGGTKKRVGRIFFDKGVMEAPNQPMGASLDIIRFLAQFFEARPGHWGGWEFFTYPVVNQIEFTNAERTTARARVVIGYSGGDVFLEKIDGAWKATKLGNMWVT